jgi:hypothetical protein
MAGEITMITTDFWWWLALGFNLLALTMNLNKVIG